MQHLPLRNDPLLVILEELTPEILILTEHDMKFNEINLLNIQNYEINSYYCRESACKLEKFGRPKPLLHELTKHK